MNAPVTKKAENKVNAKPNVAKGTADQEKAINQLKQEIRTLSKAVKEMQQRQDTQTVMITMPQELFAQFNAYLSYSNNIIGRKVNLSELICEAMQFHLWAEEENKRREEEYERAQSEKQSK